MVDLPPLTNCLIGALLLVIAYRLVRQRYPDIHPFALYHQSSISPIRNSEESAVHRSTLTPFTYPLISGLNIREGHSFRDGDLRDIWNFAKKGKLGVFNKKSDVIEYHDYDTELTSLVQTVASRFSEYVPGISKIGIYLPNSVENVVTSFAAAHYNMAAVLLPLTSDMDELSRYLEMTQPELLIFEAGVLDFTQLSLPESVHDLVIVVPSIQDHLEWKDQLNEKVGSSIGVHTWEDVVSTESPPKTVIELPQEEYNGPAIIVPYTTLLGTVESVAFSHGNIVSAVAAQLRAVSHSVSFKSTDTVVPLDSIQGMYTRIMFLAALTAGTSVVFSGTTSEGFDFDALRTIVPTVVIASPKSILHVLNYTPGLLINLRLKRASGILAAGNLPWPVLNLFPNLRLIYIHDDQPPRQAKRGEDYNNAGSLTSAQLSLLRALLGARVIYALTHPRIAGPICQTHIYDYRNLGPVRVFGPVVPALEAVVKDIENLKGGDRQGHLCLRGLPTADKGWVTTNIVGEWGDDGCFRELS
ncbi:hypothetical protein POJ06DRAFT_245168 [Lipomyces tetrasporus]|uniref:AMP-dependent synthetase/ligase domain-containing protein n=1 Tax=Lipomyces tetrasporus TaxID=54092 RepID=A0AAD7QWA3_9ASCO|nr:uncharacterized protein POJ06DRAFT_245168 [Lipomyces tetrasporus]KAJ8102629.1 hypothetical protein POJ06DRAFT_245168 [Lipomyces tetrasporus]